MDSRSTNIASCYDLQTESYYERQAGAYAEASDAIDLQPLYRSFLSMVATGGLILDAGCGSGRDIRFFEQHDLRPVGVDRSLGLIRIAASRSSSPFVVGDLRKLPFADQMFDGVWSSASLVHLPRASITFALSEMRRVSKPEAALVLSVKAGEGEIRDESGRLFTLFQADEIRHFMACAGYVVHQLCLDAQRRTRFGKVEEINWINVLATNQVMSIRTD